MEIKLDVVLKADESLLKVASLLANALKGQAQTTVSEPTGSATKAKPTEIEKEKVVAGKVQDDVIQRAGSTMYFVHTSSDEIFSIKKGDAIPTSPTIVELTKAQYLERKTAQEESKAEAEKQETIKEDKNDTSILSIVELRATFSKLSEAGKQKDGKALLAELGYKKLSEIPEEERATVKEKAEELL